MAKAKKNLPKSEEIKDLKKKKITKGEFEANLKKLLIPKPKQGN